MISFSDILKRNRDENLTSRQLEHLELISKGGHRLNELIDDLLDVSRSESGRFKLEFVPFDARDAISAVEKSYRSVFVDRNQSLEVVNLADSTYLDGDQNRIEQVLNNLLTNASKYSPGETVTKMTVSIENDMLRVEISDQGIGISKQDQRRLFVPFFRASNSETRKEAGTGLGLVIAKTIVDLHGGRIEIESQHGEGTSVRFWLPRILDKLPNGRPNHDTN